MTISLAAPHQLSTLYAEKMAKDFAWLILFIMDLFVFLDSYYMD